MNNLIRSYRQAANDILWVLDSNVMVDSGTLARAVDILEPPPTSSLMKKSTKRIGVVHHVPLAFSHSGNFGSRVEEAFLNTNHAKMYIAINTVGIESCVVGKSNLYRRSDLDQVDGSLKRRTPGEETAQGKRGLAAFGKYLAEDNTIAASLWHTLDIRHSLSCDVAHNAVGNMTLSDYIDRRVRWIRVRKHMVLAATLVEPLTECVVLSAIGAASLCHLTGGWLPWWLVGALHYVIWIWVDLDVWASLEGDGVGVKGVLGEGGRTAAGGGGWAFMAAWATRELLAFPIWMVAVWGSEVIWRGRRYRMLWNGEVERVSDSKKGSGFGSWFGLGLGRRRRKGGDGYEALEQDELPTI